MHCWGGNFYNHTCAVRAGGEVMCWGMNGQGQVGVPPGPFPANELVPVIVAIAGAVEVDVDTENSCARTVDGEVWCWGWNDGLPAPEEPGSYVVPGLAGVVELAAGDVFTCARIDGRISCWGSNVLGQLGDGTTQSRAVPAQVIGIDDAVELFAGTAGACARRAGGGVWCWGATAAQRINGDINGEPPPPLTTPAPLALDDAAGMVMALEHACAFYDGAVRCWGRGDFGILGNGSETWSYAPVAAQVCVPGN